MCCVEWGRPHCANMPMLSEPQWKQTTDSGKHALWRVPQIQSAQHNSNKALKKTQTFFFPLELRIIKTSLQSPKTQAEHELQQFPLWTILIVPETTDGNSEHKHVNIPVISVYWHRLMFQTAGTVKNRRIWPSTYRKQRYGLLKTWKCANFSS